MNFRLDVHRYLRKFNYGTIVDTRLFYVVIRTFQKYRFWSYS